MCIGRFARKLFKRDQTTRVSLVRPTAYEAGKRRQLDSSDTLSIETMPPSFDQLVEQAWTDSAWMIDDMFNHGMCFFECYIPAIALESLESSLNELTDSGLDCSNSVWGEDTAEADWHRTYSLVEYVSFFRSGRIHLLHADYNVNFAGYTFTLKLMFEREGNLEIIFYRENLLPRAETHARFVAACQYFRRLHSLFQGAALFIGPDGLDYPDWPHSAPPQWFRLA